MLNYSFEAIGTHWSIDLEDNLNNDRIFYQIKKRINDFDKNYSRFRSDSLVTQVSKQSGVFNMPADFEKMINFYKRLYDLTNGMVSPFVGNLLDQMGYDANYSFEKKELESVLSWDQYVSYQQGKLNVKIPAIMDFGAAGKGYIIDIIGDLIKSNGIGKFCIDAGGDILNCGIKNKIGLENPNDVTEVIGEIEVLSKSICASSGNRRKWREYHHIINPKTKNSQNGIMGVWVVSDDAMIADGIATCLFFIEPQKLSEFNFDYLILYPDFSIKKSNGFLANLYLKK